MIRKSYFQEALAREQFLESKLLSLQRLIGDTEVASSQGWRALMDEDRLLTRLVVFLRGVFIIFPLLQS